MTRLSAASEKISKKFLGRVKILPFLLPVTCKEDEFLQKERYSDDELYQFLQKKKAEQP